MNAAAAAADFGAKKKRRPRRAAARPPPRVLAHERRKSKRWTSTVAVLAVQHRRNARQQLGRARSETATKCVHHFGALLHDESPKQRLGAGPAKRGTHTTHAAASASATVAMAPVEVPPLVQLFLRGEHAATDEKLPGLLDELTRLGAGECCELLLIGCSSSLRASEARGSWRRRRRGDRSCAKRLCRAPQTRLLPSLRNAHKPATPTRAQEEHLQGLWAARV